MISLTPALVLENDLVLAPMDGYTDSPMRRLCCRFGATLCYTEFISTHEYLNRSPFIAQKITFLPEERPIIFQLLGENAADLLRVAHELLPLQPQAFDINLGCPQRGIVARGAGAGLLRYPQRIANIFQQLVRVLPVPITAKMRLGWDDEHRNALLVARIVEENGGAFIAVHGRTRAQGYRGSGNLDAIAEICQSVRIPVLANGVVSPECQNIPQEIERIKTLTGCAAVMIGRAAIGNPWVFSCRNRNEIPPIEVKEVMLLHLQWMLDFYGIPQGLILFRKHLTRYLAPYQLPRASLLPLLTTTSSAQFYDHLSECLDKLPSQEGENYLSPS